MSGMLVAAVAHPAWGVHDYEATAVLYVPGAARAPTATAALPTIDPFVLKPEAIAALATGRDTAVTAARRLGVDGDPMRVMRRVRARADTKAATVSITATRRADGRGAALIADAIASEVISTVDASRAAARKAAIADAETRAQGFKDVATTLDPANTATKTRRDENIRKFVETKAEAAQLAATPPTVGITIIRRTVPRKVPSGGAAAVPPAAGWLLTLIVLLGLGSGLAVAAEILDDRVREDATAVTGLEVLVVVPDTDAGPGARGAAVARLREELVERAGSERQAHPPSFVAPGVGAGGGRIVLVTSPFADGVTSRTVVGLAAAVAAAGRTALIIDCDDASHDDDDTEPRQRGVGDLAVDGLVLPSVGPLVHPTAIPRVSVVRRGAREGAASDFLARHEALLRSTTAVADVVLLHSPGVLSDDAVERLAGSVDDTVLVCRTGSHVNDARRAAAALSTIQAPPVVVLVDEPLPRISASRTPAEVVERIRHNPRARGRLEWAGAGVAMLLLFLGMRSFVFESFSIPTPSMVPYLEPGDRVLVSRLSYHFHDVHRGDVVVFGPPKAARTITSSKLIKRVIGLPGDVVESAGGKVLVNGKPLREPYLAKGVVTDGVKRQTIAKGRYWMMGDNRGDSADSRFFGSVAGGTIVGRAFFHIWPWPVGFM